MIRAALYLLASGVVWVAEGFIFSRFLGLSRAETAAMALVYVLLFSLAVWTLVRALEGQEGERGLARWRVLSLGPMIVAILGSFVSLPLLLVIVAVGHALHA